MSEAIKNNLDKFFFNWKNLTSLGVPSSPLGAVFDNESIYKRSPKRFNFYMQVLESIANPNPKVLETVVKKENQTRFQREEIQDKLKTITQYFTDAGLSGKQIAEKIKNALAGNLLTQDIKVDDNPKDIVSAQFDQLKTVLEASDHMTLSGKDVGNYKIEDFLKKLSVSSTYVANTEKQVWRDYLTTYNEVMKTVKDDLPLKLKEYEDNSELKNNITDFSKLLETVKTFLSEKNPRIDKGFIEKLITRASITINETEIKENTTWPFTQTADNASNVLSELTTLQKALLEIREIKQHYDTLPINTLDLVRKTEITKIINTINTLKQIGKLPFGLNNTSINKLIETLINTARAAAATAAREAPAAVVAEAPGTAAPRPLQRFMSLGGGREEEVLKEYIDTKSNLEEPLNAALEVIKTTIADILKKPISESEDNSLGKMLTTLDKTLTELEEKKTKAIKATSTFIDKLQPSPKIGGANINLEDLIASLSRSSAEKGGGGPEINSLKEKLFPSIDPTTRDPTSPAKLFSNLPKDNYKERDELIAKYENDVYFSPENEKVAWSDRAIFLALTYIIRSISLFLTEWSIYSGFINNFVNAFALYFGMYTCIFLLVVFLTNARRDDMVFRMIFFYMNSQAENGKGVIRILVHMICILMLLPIPYVVKEYREFDQPSVLSFSDKANILSGVEKFSMYTWILTSIVALNV